MYIYKYILFVILYCMMVSYGIDFSLSVLYGGVILSSNDNNYTIIHSSSLFIISSNVDC